MSDTKGLVTQRAHLEAKILAELDVQAGLTTDTIAKQISPRIGPTERSHEVAIRKLLSSLENSGRVRKVEGTKPTRWIKAGAAPVQSSSRMDSQKTLALPGYKDFPKGDPRRYFVALLAADQLGDLATAHYVAKEIGSTRAVAQRALEAAQNQFGVTLRRDGPHYEITDWGVLDKDKLVQFFGKNHEED